MFEQAFKNIDDILWKEAGCTTELDYTEQTSWLLFLKYLDGLEQDKADEAKLEGKRYSFILDIDYRWESWATPKGRDGQIDHNKAQTGDDLRDFVNLKLFPYLHSFKQKASGPNTIEYKIGEIFGEIKNKIQSGYNLREIIDHIDELRFRSQKEKHELSHLPEGQGQPDHERSDDASNPHLLREGKEVPCLCHCHYEHVMLPPIGVQTEIVKTANDLTAETQRLESIYQHKLAALDELKKSLLHQAFSGSVVR